MKQPGFNSWFRNGRKVTIRGRLGLSILLILALFALNLGVYFVSNGKRKATVNELQRAIASQILIADIHQRLNDSQKQIALLNQVASDSGVGAAPEEIANFRSQMETVRQKIAQLHTLSDLDIRKPVDTLAREFQALSNSWITFYENFGVHYSVAITELALRGDPMSQHVLQQTVPQILEAERVRVARTDATFHSVGIWADRLTISIFLLSGLVAGVIAIRLSRHVERGLSDLKRGADLIGAGDLDHSISIRSDDELGDLASSFNHMSAQLKTAYSNLTQANEELASRHQEVQQQRERSDSLLLNILPSQIAEELRSKGLVDPKYFEDVTILFTDFVGFSNSTTKLSAEDLVHLLHDYFTAFDQIAMRYGLEKLKTIGDSYMCVGGMPARTPSHPVDMVMAAFEMVEAVRSRAGDGPGWGVRIGIHTGPVIAGVVGIRKFAFDVWGESVNLSSRMESSGAENRVNISRQTYSRVKDFFACESRGPIMTKDKLSHDMYFVDSLLPALVGAGNPPAPFSRRYGIYFQKQPPAFPPTLLALDTISQPEPLLETEISGA